MKKTRFLLSLFFIFFFIYNIYAENTVSPLNDNKKNETVLKKNSECEKKIDCIKKNKVAFKDKSDIKINIIKMELILSIIFISLILIFIFRILLKLKGIKKIQDSIQIRI